MSEPEATADKAPDTPDEVVVSGSPTASPCADCQAMERRLYVAGAVSGVVVGALIFYIVASRLNA